LRNSAKVQKQQGGGREEEEIPQRRNWGGNEPKGMDRADIKRGRRRTKHPETGGHGPREGEKKWN